MIERVYLISTQSAMSEITDHSGLFRLNGTLPEQSKLAFGKRAQNVRLSSKLIGWNINIQIDAPGKNTLSLEDRIQKAVDDLAADTGLDKATAGALVSRGYLSAGDLMDADAEELMNLPGVDADALQQALDELNAR